MGAARERYNIYILIIHQPNFKRFVRHPPGIGNIFLLGIHTILMAFMLLYIWKSMDKLDRKAQKTASKIQ